MANVDGNHIVSRLRRGKLVRLTCDEWDAASSGFELLERHDTGLHGALLVVRSAAGWAVVEQPSPSERVVRPLPDHSSTLAFVAKRAAQYERMWDGCGCRIDYYE